MIKSSLWLISTDNAKKIKKNSFFSFNLYERYIIYDPVFKDFSEIINGVNIYVFMEPFGVWGIEMSWVSVVDMEVDRMDKYLVCVSFSDGHISDRLKGDKR